MAVQPAPDVHNGSIPATTERFKALSEQRRRRLSIVRGLLYFVPHNPLHRKLKKERLGGEDYLRLIFHRQHLQCRLVAGVEETAIGDEQLLGIAKTFDCGSPF